MGKAKAKSSGGSTAGFDEGAAEAVGLALEAHEVLNLGASGHLLSTPRGEAGGGSAGIAIDFTKARNLTAPSAPSGGGTSAAAVLGKRKSRVQQSVQTIEQIEKALALGEAGSRAGSRAPSAKPSPRPSATAPGTGPVAPAASSAKPAAAAAPSAPTTSASRKSEAVPKRRDFTLRHVGGSSSASSVSEQSRPRGTGKAAKSSLAPPAAAGSGRSSAVSAGLRLAQRNAAKKAGAKHGAGIPGSGGSGISGSGLAGLGVGSGLASSKFTMMGASTVSRLQDQMHKDDKAGFSGGGAIHDTDLTQTSQLLKNEEDADLARALAGLTQDRGPSYMEQLANLPENFGPTGASKAKAAGGTGENLEQGFLDNLKALEAACNDDLSNLSPEDRARTQRGLGSFMVQMDAANAAAAERAKADAIAAAESDSCASLSTGGSPRRGRGRGRGRRGRGGGGGSGSDSEDDGEEEEEEEKNVALATLQYFVIAIILIAGCFFGGAGVKGCVDGDTKKGI